jgi:hypothetical protein
VKVPMERVTKTAGDSCWHMTQRVFLSTNRIRMTHLEQASLCPQGPNATDSSGSAQIRQQSSMSCSCFASADGIKYERRPANRTPLLASSWARMARHLRVLCGEVKPPATKNRTASVE